MKNIFISYSTKDRDFATKLGERLREHYEVFLDFSGIPGGLEWEAKIESSIRDADVFLTVVTEASSTSQWVARETLYAETLGKPRIPILLSGELPFRLINLQYIDFRGTFDAGISDLMESVKVHAAPQPRSQHEANALLALAVRARLSGDWVTSENLIKQAVALDVTLSYQKDGFWNRLAQPERSIPIRNQFPSFQIIERTEELQEQKYKDDKAYRWTVSLGGPSGFLEIVDNVEYLLHPTFKVKSQVVRSRQSGFMLTNVGWGQFTLRLKVNFVDGSLVEVPYFLTFEKENKQDIPLG